MEEEEARKEEDRGKVAVAGAVDVVAHHVTLNFYLKYQNEINCLSFIL